MDAKSELEKGDYNNHPSHGKIFGTSMPFLVPLPSQKQLKADYKDQCCQWQREPNNAFLNYSPQPVFLLTHWRMPLWDLHWVTNEHHPFHCILCQLPIKKTKIIFCLQTFTTHNVTMQLIRHYLETLNLRAAGQFWHYLSILKILQLVCISNYNMHIMHFCKNVTNRKIFPETHYHNFIDIE